jgi:hypothetical protein
MKFKFGAKQNGLLFTVPTIIAAIIAGASAFGAAYQLANSDLVITNVEWFTIAWATISAVVPALFDSKP